MNVIAYDPRLSPEDGAKYGAKMMPDMDSVLKNADFVTLHTPQTEETIHMMSKEQFAKMKPSAYFINCSRGPIVDEKGTYRSVGKPNYRRCCPRLSLKQNQRIKTENFWILTRNCFLWKILLSVLILLPLLSVVPEKWLFSQQNRWSKYLRVRKQIGL